MSEHTQDYQDHQDQNVSSGTDTSVNALRSKIISITPHGQDPVVFWHQVARDAIKTSEKDRKRAEDARREQARAEHDLQYFTERLVERTADQKARIPLDVSNLVRMARDGEIDLSVSLYINGKGRNTDDD